MSIITNYKLREIDNLRENRYLAEILELIDNNRNTAHDNLSTLLNEKRYDFITEYAFAIPTGDILEKITEYSPIVEVGAGTGYCAMCLHSLGADVIAYDIRPPGENLPWDWQSGNQWFDETWYYVNEGDERSAAAHPDRALFLCWPPVHSPMARNTLHHYRKAGGEIIIFLGDPGGSADEQFFNDLKNTTTILSESETWSWPGIEEILIVSRLITPDSVK